MTTTLRKASTGEIVASWILKELDGDRWKIRRDTFAYLEKPYYRHRFIRKRESAVVRERRTIVTATGDGLVSRPPVVPFSDVILSDS